MMMVIRISSVVSPITITMNALERYSRSPGFAAPVTCLPVSYFFFAPFPASSVNQSARRPSVFG